MLLVAPAAHKPRWNIFAVEMVRTDNYPHTSMVHQSVAVSAKESGERRQRHYRFKK
jgi:hypothetical protein